MKKKNLFFYILLFILLVPKRNVYEDGGTKTYTSLVYKIIFWHRIDHDVEGGYKTNTEIYFIPNNFHDLDYYLLN